MELAIEQAKGEAASKAQHAEQVIDGLKIKIAALQAQLSQAEQIVGGLVENSRLLLQTRPSKCSTKTRNRPANRFKQPS